MASKTATLYLDDASIRLLVTRGHRVKKWAETKLEPGLLTGLVAGDPTKLGEYLRQFLRAQRAACHKYVIGISAVHCLTRQIFLPSLPRNLMDEAIIREARRLLPLPVEQLYLSWRTTGALEGKVSVFLVGLRRASVDSLVAALKTARIKATTLFLKPLALARLVKENAILVDVQAADFDICMLVDGVPQPIRSIPFPSTNAAWQAKLPIIMDEIDRTIKFYADNNPKKPLAENVPMYVSGELISRARVWQRMTERFTFRVVPLGSDQDRPDGFDPDLFLVNTAMGIKERGSLLGGETPVTAMNLLPEEHRARPVKWGRVLAVPAATAFVGVIVPLSMLVTGASDNLTATRSQLEASSRVLQEKQALKQEMRADLTKLNGKLADVSKTLEACAAMANALSNRATMLNTDLDTVNLNTGVVVRLSRVDEDKTSLVVSGTAASESDILLYARALDASGRFEQTVVSKISSSDTGVKSFTLTLLRQVRQSGAAKR